MSEKLTDIQVRWQGAALKVLLRLAPECEREHRRGPWVPADVATAEIQGETGCTTQAATGALRALLRVGLAARAETSEGLFWKPTEAAVRSYALFHETGKVGK